MLDEICEMNRRLEWGRSARSSRRSFALMGEIDGFTATTPQSMTPRRSESPITITTDDHDHDHDEEEEKIYERIDC